MCGIVGMLDPRRATTQVELESIVATMATTLTHRGPDDAGSWAHDRAGVGLGFRRLSILDLSPTGRQPMVSHDGRFTLVFNGEVYNHLSLRAELEADVEFRGRSDTEVLLEAIARWGIRTALERSNGMFAFACWDAQEEALWLARDRFGEKPLYYGWLGSRFVFGSELKAIRACPDFKGEIDRNALASYFRHAYIPAPHSIYRGVSKLPPATFLRVDPRGPGAEQTEVYWSAVEVALDVASNARQLAGHEAADAVEAALGTSIGLRMVADVPVGALLSGGTDSSLVVALMQAQSAQAVRTYTIGFPDEGYDEATRARGIAEHLGTDHTELYVSPTEAQSVVPRLPYVYDEPFADSSQIPTLLVSQLARRDVTVALSGDGGDELFGGYARYAAMARLHRVGRIPRGVRAPIARALRSQPPQWWDRMVRGGAKVVPGVHAPTQPGDKIHKLAGALSAAPPERYRSMIECWGSSIVLDADEPATVLSPPTEWPLQPAEWAMLADTITYLPDDLLVKVDRASMAVSLEARVPMLDPDVYEVAWRLAPAARLHRGRGKQVLLDVLRRHLPIGLTGGPKAGFAVPFGSWLRGPLRPWADALLDRDRLRAESFLEVDTIHRCWDEHLSGSHDHRHRLWAVLMFEAWLESQH